MATAQDAGRASSPPPDPAPPGRRSKRRAPTAAASTGRRGGGGGPPPPPPPGADDMVHVEPVPPEVAALLEDTAWRPQRLSETDKAPQITLGADGSATSGKGYCVARAAHGAHAGAWYYEVELTRVPRAAGAAARVGFATRGAELQAPVGYDAKGYAVRTVGGDAVTAALRRPYGKRHIEEGSTIGCYLYLPPGASRPLERTLDDVVTWRGGLYFVKRPEAPPAPVPGSVIAFSVDGEAWGVAHEPLLEGTYYPAISLFTPPELTAGASVRVNFGPAFKHAPVAPRPGLPPPRPACEMAGDPPVAAAALNAAAETAALDAVAGVEAAGG